MTLLDELSKKTVLPKESLRKYIRTCPKRYKVYSIAKRNGGSRIIAQPSSTVKSLQRELVEILKPDLPVHDCAMAYREGISIYDNALKHKDNAFLLKMDFENFFPSIKAVDVLAHISKNYKKFENEDAATLVSILFRKVRESGAYSLSIGAPSSPFISNTIMYDFDVFIANKMHSLGVYYTRYADDLVFSTKEKGVLFDVPYEVIGALKDLGYDSVKINRDKTVFSSKKHNRHVTGLVITNEGNISVGRNKKRQLRTLVYKYKSGDLNDEEIQRLKGEVSHARFVEPKFWDKLKDKYGLNDSFFTV